MDEVITKKQVSICGPFSEEAYNSQRLFLTLAGAYEDPKSDFGNREWLTLLENNIKDWGFNNVPTVQFGMAKRFYETGKSDKGWPYLKQSIHYAFRHKSPERLITDIITLMLNNNMADFAVRLAEETIKRFPDDATMHATLGNCYIRAGRADEGVRHLAQAIKRFPDNAIMHNTLGIASAEAKMQKIFDWVKPKMDLSPSFIDYLDAKLHYLQNDNRRARQILEPYVANIEKCKNSILGLFLATIADDKGIHAIFSLFKGRTTYDFLLQRRDEWRENPLRDLLPETSDTYSSSWRVHEEGALPVSTHSRRASGFGRPGP